MSQSPVTLQSPETRFQSVPKNIQDHRQMVDSEAFARAVDVAMLQYALEVAQPVKDANSAVAAGFMLKGAQEFLATLKTISEKPVLSVRTPPQNLDHNA